jgi:ATP-dependent DNA helicase RecG
MLSLDSPITELYRVGRSTAADFKRLGLEKVRDLLFYFPFRYEEYQEGTMIADLKPGEIASVRGLIELISNRKSPRRRIYVTEALIADESGTIKATWFNQPFLAKTYHPGDEVSLAGKVQDNYGQIFLSSPVIEKLGHGKAINTQGIVPVYHLSGNLTQKQLRFLIKESLKHAGEEVDWLPENIRKKLKLPELKEALLKIHFPEKNEDFLTAKARLSFSELFLRQIKSLLIRQALKDRRAEKIKFQEAETKRFVASLPFKLTDDQRQAAWEIIGDISQEKPMSRLLEGDVGSGKTVAVALAILNVALNKKKSLFMVPTEILAEQHFQTFKRLFKDWPIKIAVFTRSNKSKEAATADLIIGTQAVIQEKSDFKNIALTIIDEQHRFGVLQRQKIIDLNREAGLTPHFLSLTATPIPRSLALAIYGDLDLSIIKQMPAGRQTVATKVVEEKQREAAYKFIRQEIKAGRQAFVVCPLIDNSDTSGAKSVKEEHAKLEREIFPDLKVGLLHGRLKPKEKEKVMADFSAGRIQILVSTSVIEVGIDVPNASLMIIEGAERFGLAQLHQFRGRVGRGGQKAYCLLFISNEEDASEKTLDRLKSLEKFHNGFDLAKIDLKMRGSGDLSGIEQSGWPELRLASIFDFENIRLARQEANLLIEADKKLEKYPLIKKMLGDFEDKMHLE